jgi:serralysin
MLASSHKSFSRPVLDPYGSGARRLGDTWVPDYSIGTVPPPDFGQAPADDPTGAGGNGGTSTPVTASGDQRIDGLLTGVKWATGSISYTDPDSASDYQSGYFVDVNNNSTSAQNEGFSHISAGQLLAVHYALNDTAYTQSSGAHGFSVEGFSNLDISYGSAGSGFGTIRVANTSDNLYGFTYYPASSVQGGDAWMGSQIQSPVQGNYDWNNTLHELGHALGLKHGHQDGGPANTALPTDVDSLEFTLMTYRSYVGAPLTGYTNGTWDYPQTFMMLDIAALQYMYGADFSTDGANVGNTTYTWSQTSGQSFVNGTVGTSPGGNRIFMTIWDAGGNDTYDLSNYTSGLDINLKPGEWSTFDTNQLADLTGGSRDTGLARGNVANALQYNGDARSLIENAIGGSGNDTLYGNAANNMLRGNGGADTLRGFGGIDTLYGRAGNDSYYIDTKGDTASEAHGSGHDTVFSWLDFTIGAGIEDLTLVGTRKTIATGNGGANVLTGNISHNVLVGGGGKDTFVFETALGNYDTIADFNHKADTFELDNAVFIGLQTGKLAGSAFKQISNGGVDGSDRILYDAKHGDLYFDRDGSGHTYDRILFAHVDPKTGIDNSDFMIV